MKIAKQFILIFIMLSIITACDQPISEKSSAPIKPNAFKIANIIEIPGLQQTFIEPLPELELNAASAILIHADTNDILYDNNSQEPLPVASMSKIMSELLVLEAIDEGNLQWDDEIIPSKYAYMISNHPGFSSVNLQQNESYTVRELFAAMAISSANGATIALAEAVAGTEEKFVAKMNHKANELGLFHSHFVNSTGLTNWDLGDYSSVGKPSDSNTMSASDVAQLAIYIIEAYPEVLRVSNTTEVNFHGKTFKNSNWMLPKATSGEISENLTFKGVNGLKTGFTDEAGYCFTGSVEIDNEQFISVVMGTSSISERFLETKKLYETVQQQLLLNK